MNDTLIHACEMFLLPTTILFLAFAIAPNETLKTLISALGFIMSIIWAFHLTFWTGILTSVDFASTLILSLIFLVAWAIVAYPHAGLGALTPNAFPWTRKMSFAHRKEAL